MLYFILLILIIPFVIYIVRYTGSRMKFDKCSSVDPNATIVEVHSESDNWGKNKHIKTIVFFSDGSEYHTYFTKNEPGFGSTRIVVDDEVIEEIKRRAMIAHRKKYDKFSKN